jgi:hypothetical protein
MIGQLRGRLAEKRPNQVLVDVGGVGYLVQVPLSSYAALGELHTEVTLLIHTHVREDALALYGFVSSREKHLFEMLLSASGVGPTLALKILSGMSVEELVPAIRGNDVARLTKIPGVGRKTAERSRNLGNSKTGRSLAGGRRGRRNLRAGQFRLRRTSCGNRCRRSKARSRHNEFRKIATRRPAIVSRFQRPNKPCKRVSVYL